MERDKSRNGETIEAENHFPDQKGLVLPRAHPAAGWALIKKYRRFFWFWGGIVFLFAFHNMVNTYLIQIMERFGRKQL